MSFQSELQLMISKPLEYFLQEIADLYVVSVDDIKDVWCNGKKKGKVTVLKRAPVKEKKKEKKEKKKYDEYVEGVNFSCVELKAFCKKKGYSQSGSKQCMIDQLTGKIEPKMARGPVKGDIGGLKLKKKQLKSVFKKTEENIKKLKKGKITFKVSLNKHGNFQHTESKLVIDPKTNIVVGSQMEEDLVALSLGEIDMCRKYGLEFNIPYTFHTNEEKNKDINEIEHLTVDDYSDLENAGEDSD